MKSTCCCCCRGKSVLMRFKKKKKREWLCCYCCLYRSVLDCILLLLFCSRRGSVVQSRRPAGGYFPDPRCGGTYSVLCKSMRPPMHPNQWQLYLQCKTAISEHCPVKPAMRDRNQWILSSKTCNARPLRSVNTSVLRPRFIIRNKLYCMLKEVTPYIIWQFPPSCGSKSRILLWSPVELCPQAGWGLWRPLPVRACVRACLCVCYAYQWFIVNTLSSAINHFNKHRSQRMRETLRKWSPHRQLLHVSEYRQWRRLLRTWFSVVIGLGLAGPNTSCYSEFYGTAVIPTWYIVNVLSTGPPIIRFPCNLMRNCWELKCIVQHTCMKYHFL